MKAYALKLAATLVLLGVCFPVFADAFGPFRTLMLKPSEHVLPGELVTVEGTFQNVLYIEPFADVERDGNVVRVTVYLSDLTEPTLTTRQFPIGRFEPGRYRVEFYLRPVLEPPGIDEPSTLFHTETLQVGPSPVPVGGWGIAAAAALMCAVGLVRLRLRSFESREPSSSSPSM